MSKIELITANNIQALSRFPDNHFHSVATDAPYGLGAEPDPAEMLRAWLDTGYMEVKGGGFMGKKWDAFVPQPAFWREVYRVLKPGGYVACFFGTRTYDWGVMAMRLAGFEVCDQIKWLYGSGFPKNRDVERSIAMHQCEAPGRHFMRALPPEDKRLSDDHVCERTQDSEKWDGWGTALKPAFEPIVLARKPLIGTVAENVLQHGAGGLNIETCRVREELRYNPSAPTNQIYGQFKGHEDLGRPAIGRWPANVLHDGSDEVVGMFPDSEGQRGIASQSLNESKNAIYGKNKNYTVNPLPRNDSGSAARFFYCAKASQFERSAGLEHREAQNVNDGRKTSIDNAYQRGDTLRRNTHPTVKPIAVMLWLCKLITPPSGRILDPFVGSGTTGIAAKLGDFQFCGIDMSREYIEDIARPRIDWWNEYRWLQYQGIKPQYKLEL